MVSAVSISIRLGAATLLAMSLIGCAAGGSCGGNPDDEVVMLSDGGIQVVEEEELSDIERMCRVVCSSTDILNDGLREVCGCPCLNDPAATFRAPYGNECEPPDDRCSIPEGRIRCIPCIADNGEEIAPFSSYASGNSQCYCNGGTGDMFCEAQLDVVVISGG